MKYAKNRHFELRAKHTNPLLFHTSERYFYEQYVNMTNIAVFPLNQQHSNKKDMDSPVSTRLD